MYAARANRPIDGEIAKKTHFVMETSLNSAVRRCITEVSMGILAPLERYSSFRRIALAQWKPATNPVIYGQMWIDVTDAEAFLAAQRETHQVRVSLGTLVGKAAAIALGAIPEANAKVVGRKIYLKNSVDVYYQVDVGKGSDLTGTVIEGADKKPLHEIARELSDAAQRIRAGRDEQYEKTQKGGLFRYSPIWLLALILRLFSFLLFRVGVPSRVLGGSNPDPFGSCMVTNVAGFGIDVAYAPLVPWTRTPYILLVGMAQDRPTVIDGEVVVRRFLPVSATIDHRVLDGALIGKFAKILRGFVSAPNDAGTVTVDGVEYGGPANT